VEANKPKSGLPKLAEHIVVSDQGNNQRYCEDRHRTEIFSNNHIKVASGQGKKQFIGSLSSFIRPNTHGDGRNETEKDMGKKRFNWSRLARLESKNSCGQKAAKSTSEQEGTDKDISAWAAKISG
jgi:hypothetical protein